MTCIREVAPRTAIPPARLRDSHLHRTCGAPQVQVSRPCVALGMTSEIALIP